MVGSFFFFFCIGPVRGVSRRTRRERGGTARKRGVTSAVVGLRVRHGGDRVGRLKRIGTVVVHLFGEAVHDGEGVLVEVSDHGVGMPASHELYGVGVNFAAQ